jgi:outer membrane murein-binding lipoprotein Lpp
MKKTIFTLAVATTLMAGTIFTGCQSSDAKVDAAKDKVQDAKQDLKEVQKDANTEAQKAANAEEWKKFKSESEIKIRDNEIRIAELREKMKKSGKTLDALREKRIDELEQKNRDLRSRIDAYDKSQSNWESFKREFSHDMDELGQALKDLTVDNKK